MTTATSLWLKTRPYTLIDAVNRKAAALGAPRYAQQATYADYNGHHVTVSWNTYRRYWVAEYFWAGRVVLARGTLVDCLAAAKREYDRGALGAAVVVTGLTAPEQVAAAAALGFEAYTPAISQAWYESWADARYAEIEFAMRWEAQFGVPAVALLLQARDVAEYHALRDGYRHQLQQRA